MYGQPGEPCKGLVASIVGRLLARPSSQHHLNGGVTARSQKNLGGRRTKVTCYSADRMFVVRIVANQFWIELCQKPTEQPCHGGVDQLVGGCDHVAAGARDRSGALPSAHEGSSRIQMPWFGAPAAAVFPGMLSFHYGRKAVCRIRIARLIELPRGVLVE